MNSKTKFPLLNIGTNTRSKPMIIDPGCSNPTYAVIIPGHKIIGEVRHIASWSNKLSIKSRQDHYWPCQSNESCLSHGSHFSVSFASFQTLYSFTRDINDVGSLGKHIHGLDLTDLVAAAAEDGGITGKGGGAAGDIDNTLGHDGQDGLQDFCVAAGTGRVQDDHVRLHTFPDETGQFHGSIGADEFTVSDPVLTGILPGILDGRGHDLDAQGMPGFLGQEEGDGAGPAVQVDDVFPARERCIMQRGLIEGFGLACIDLEKRQGRDGKSQCSQPVMDGAGTMDDPAFGSQDDIGMPRIDVLDQGHESGQVLLQQGNKLFQVGNPVRVRHEDHHDFSRVDTDPAHDMADHACPGILVQGGDVVFFHPVPDDGCDPVVGLCLDEAVIHIDDAVRSLGVAADLQFMAAVFRSGHLHLVAVMPGHFSTQRGVDIDAREMPDPFQCVDDGLPFLDQLGRVGKVLQLTAAAGFVDGAGRFYPVG